MPRFYTANKGTGSSTYLNTKIHVFNLKLRVCHCSCNMLSAVMAVSITSSQKRESKKKPTGSKA